MQSLQPGTRAGHRPRVLLTGTVFTPEGAQRVILLDITCTGAKIRTETPLLPLCDAILKRESLFAAAHVAWSRGREAGLNFYRELAPEELDTALQQVLLRSA